MSELIYQINLEQGTLYIYNDRPLVSFLKVNQIHSNIIFNEEEIDEQSKGDGILSTSNTPIATLTADCLPIIVEGLNGHAILHAGWKGVRDQIAIDEKINKINPFHFYIGPHIKVNNYEVSEDFKLNFPNSLNFKNINGKLHFDLQSEVIAQIKSKFPKAKVSFSEICTFEDQKLNSFRRNKTNKRNYNIYVFHGGTR